MRAQPRLVQLTNPSDPMRRLDIGASRGTSLPSIPQPRQVLARAYSTAKKSANKHPLSARWRSCTLINASSVSGRALHFKDYKILPDRDRDRTKSQAVPQDSSEDSKTTTATTTNATSKGDQDTAVKATNKDDSPAGKEDGPDRRKQGRVGRWMVYAQLQVGNVVGGMFNV